MLIELFLMGIILAGLLLFIGYRIESFPLLYFSMAIFLFLGLFLFQNGLEINSGEIITDSGANTIVTDVYTTYTTSNNIVVNIFANLMFYGAFVGILMTTFVAVQSRDDW